MAVAGSALALDTIFFRYAASGMTSEARWKFGANRLSFKGGTDKRTLQLYIPDVLCQGIISITVSIAIFVSVLVVHTK